MVVGESLRVRQIGGRTQGQAVAAALHEPKEAIVERIPQRDGSVMAAEAELGAVLRRDGTDGGLQSGAAVRLKLGGGKAVIPQIGAVAGGSTGIVGRVAENAGVGSGNRTNRGAGGSAEVMPCIDDGGVVARAIESDAGTRQGQKRRDIKPAAHFTALPQRRHPVPYPAAGGKSAHDGCSRRKRTRCRG